MQAPIARSEEIRSWPRRPTRPFSRAAVADTRTAGAGVARLGAFAGPFAGKLSEVASNDGSAFLPSSAESTEVNDLRAAFDETDATAGGRRRRAPGRPRRRRPGLPRDGERRPGGAAVQRRTADPGAALRRGPARSRAVGRAHRRRCGGRRDAVAEIRSRSRGRPPRRARRARHRPGRARRRPRGGLRRRRRPPAARGRRGRRGDPRARLPLPAAADPGAAVLRFRPRRRQRGRVRPGRRGRHRPQRTEPGHPVHPRVRRRHRLRTAAGRPLPRRARHRRRPLHGGPQGAARHDRAHRGLRRDRDPRRAVPAVQPVGVQPRPRSGGGDRHRGVVPGRGDVPPGGAGPVRAGRVLAAPGREGAAAPPFTAVVGVAGLVARRPGRSGSRRPPAW